MNLLKFLYPDRCPLCDTARPIKETGFCPECLKKLPVIKDPVCHKCGRPLDAYKMFCSECEEKKTEYDGGRCIYAYTDIVESLYRFKYMGRKAYAKTYAEEMVKHLGDWLSGLKPDALIPVPIHKNRLIHRGYNQAEELALEISKLTGIPVKASLAARVVNTAPQKQKGALERRINLKKAFLVRENVVNLNKVVIVDDIFTTGSTIDSLAGELKRAGIEKVYFFSISRAGESN